MTTNPSDLPSRVEQTLSACPQFRILITGNTGIGKSSLVSKVFNVDFHELVIAHDHPGRANIEHGFTSSTNPRFILHDSEGYEPGNKDRWTVAETFIKDRASRKHPQERVHAIWLCIETPRTGGRLLQVGDEMLINLVLKMKLPLLVIFTKYDILITEKLSEAHKDNTGRSHTQDFSERLKTATKRANDDFQRRVKELAENSAMTIEHIVVSTKGKDFGVLLDSFQKLTEVTRQMLHDVEGELYVSWAAAQQVNAWQKIETSISEGFKKYWLDLGTNIVFKDSPMWDCISRIHRDILEIWNFNDPDDLLTGNEFSTQMVQLTRPIIEEGQSGNLSELSDAVTVAGQIATAFAQALSAAGITAITISFLYKRYQQIPITSLYLASYITSLIIILQRLFIETLARDPPRPLTKDLVTSAWQTFVDNDSKRILKQVKEATNGGAIKNPEDEVAGIIKAFFHIDDSFRPEVGSTMDTRGANFMSEELNIDTPRQSSSTFTSPPKEMPVPDASLGNKKKKSSNPFSKVKKFFASL